MNIEYLIRKALDMKASDIHLVTELPPCVRAAGEILALDEDPLGPETVDELTYDLLSREQRREFEKNRRICFSTIFKETAHVRVSLYSRMGKVEAAIRLRSFELRTLEQLGLPPSVAELTRQPNGLVLITGPTGVGKTTTLYSMIDLINREQRKKIITIEDPIEYLHSHKRSMVVQQEVGRDADSYHAALMHILRLDPDVICVGEMRDSETISTALLAAETGHLVLATLHTTSAAQTVERILTAVPPDQRGTANMQLANCLRGAITQVLLPTMDKSERVLAYEIMLGSAAVKNNIRKGSIPGLEMTIQSGQMGMKSLDSCLRELYEGATINYDTAASFAKDPAMIAGRNGAVNGSLHA